MRIAGILADRDSVIYGWIATLFVAHLNLLAEDAQTTKRMPLARIGERNGVLFVIQRKSREKNVVLLVTGDIQAMKRTLLVKIGERNALLFIVRRTSSEKHLVFFTGDRSLDGDRKSR